MSTKTKKTVSKKPATKKTVKLKAFNRKNALAFADHIYSEKDGRISFTKLCDGSLKVGEGEKTLHCAIGEAIATFVNPDVSTFHGNATLAIKALIEASKLKFPSEESKDDLYDALNSCLDNNDSVSGASDGDDAPSTFVERAQQVRTSWLEEVVPLLK